MPPAFNSRPAAKRIPFCLWDISLILRGLQNAQLFLSWTEKRPSELHGASTRILSNNSQGLNRRASVNLQVTFSAFISESTLLSLKKRPLIFSTAVIVPWLCISAAIWVVLLPGAAQKSRTDRKSTRLNSSHNS